MGVVIGSGSGGEAFSIDFISAKRALKINHQSYVPKRLRASSLVYNS
jgi:hypothetical protein